MTVAEKPIVRVMAQCREIRRSWSDAERLRRRRLGDMRRLRLMQLLASSDKRDAA